MSSREGAEWQNRSLSTATGHGMAPDGTGKSNVAVEILRIFQELYEAFRENLKFNDLLLFARHQMGRMTSWSES